VFIEQASTYFDILTPHAASLDVWTSEYQRPPEPRLSRCADGTTLFAFSRLFAVARI
jgi:trans-aconitate methyltransferase